MTTFLILAIVLILLFGAAVVRSAIAVFTAIALAAIGVAYTIYLTGLDPLTLCVIVFIVAIPFAIREQVKRFTDHSK